VFRFDPHPVLREGPGRVGLIPEGLSLGVSDDEVRRNAGVEWRDVGDCRLGGPSLIGRLRVEVAKPRPIMSGVCACFMREL